MSCVPAPACKALLAEATRLWPKRSKASDGICASPKHSRQNPTSDHELGNAVDLTDDPANGCAAHVLGEQIRLRRDMRVKYLISRSRICSPVPIGNYAAWAWRPYSGSNPHDKHLHVSIYARYRNDTSAWFAQPEAPAPATPWKWSNHMPGPLETTSAAVSPSGGIWKQSAEGGVYAVDGAPYLGAYNGHPELGGNVRYFVAIVPSPAGGYVQVANDGATYRWDPK